MQLFWLEVISCINHILKQSLVFVDMHILLNYLPIVWKLSEGQWTLFAITVAKSTEMLKDKCPLAIDFKLSIFKSMAHYRIQLSMDKFLDTCKPFSKVYV